MTARGRIPSQQENKRKENPPDSVRVSLSKDKTENDRGGHPVSSPHPGLYVHPCTCTCDMHMYYKDGYIHTYIHTHSQEFCITFFDLIHLLPQLFTNLSSYPLSIHLCVLFLKLYYNRNISCLQTLPCTPFCPLSRS